MTYRDTPQTWTRKNILQIAGIGAVAGALAATAANVAERYLHASSLQQTLIVAIGVGVTVALSDVARRRLFARSDRAGRA